MKIKLTRLSSNDPQFRVTPPPLSLNGRLRPSTCVCEQKFEEATAAFLSSLLSAFVYSSALHTFMEEELLSLLFPLWFYNPGKYLGSQEIIKMWTDDLTPEPRGQKETN